MKIAILTDSTCDLSSAYINKYDIEKVPLNVHFGNQTYQDGVDMTPEKFFSKLAAVDELPRTSQPAVGFFIQKYKKLARKYKKIISIHLSAELSGTVEAARLAARQLPELEIEIIDSRSVSLGLGFQVLLAAKMIKNNYDVDEIGRFIKKAQENMIIYFTASDLKYLEKGGRIGKASAFLGTILNFNPVLEIDHENGEVLPLEKVRGVKKTMKRMISLLKDNLADNEMNWVGLINGDNKAVFDNFKEQALILLKNRDSLVIESRISPVLGSHIGPTIYGFAAVKGDFLEI